MADTNDFFLLSFTVGSTVHRYTTNGIDVVYGGFTWYAGYITDEDMPDIEQTSRLKENEAKFVLADLDASLYTQLATEQWRFNTLQLQLAVLDSNMQITSVEPLYKARLIDYEHSQTDETETVQLICHNWFAKKYQQGYRTNLESQHQRDPNDDCFEYTGLITEDQPWGKEGKPSIFIAGGSTRRVRASSNNVKPADLT